MLSSRPCPVLCSRLCPVLCSRPCPVLCSSLVAPKPPQSSAQNSFHASYLNAKTFDLFALVFCVLLHFKHLKSWLCFSAVLILLACLICALIFILTLLKLAEVCLTLRCVSLTSHKMVCLQFWNNTPTWSRV